MHAFKDYKLVIAGNSNTEYGKKVKDLIAKEKLTNQIILPGKISDNDKAWLYKNCESFLFPSLAEGFGMPVIEAMRDLDSIWTDYVTMEGIDRLKNMLRGDLTQ